MKKGGRGGEGAAERGGGGDEDKKQKFVYKTLRGPFFSRELLAAEEALQRGHLEVRGEHHDNHLKYAPVALL